MGNRLAESKAQFRPLLSVKESQTDIYISRFFMTAWLGNRPIDLPFEEDAGVKGRIQFSAMTYESCLIFRSLIKF